MIKNVLPDGTLILAADPKGSHRIWQLVYTELATADVQGLEAHFSACAGMFRGFTFIDPTENMLVWSSDLRNAPWQRKSLIQLTPGLPDPDGDTAGFTATNTGQTSLQISQTLAVPANYQYCFSLYATSAQPAEIVLARSGLSTQESTSFTVGPAWSRIVSSGRLNDSGVTFTVGVGLAAGQQVGLYGMQLEAQVSPSRFRPTNNLGGVYANAHWGVDQLTIAAEAPNLYSTSFSIEAAI